MTGQVKRVIALDVGEKRFGVAVSDPFGWTAQGLETIHSKGWENDRSRVRELLRQYDTNRLLVGMPLNLKGEEGHQAQQVRLFLQPLIDEGIEVRFQDERLTSVLADRTLMEAGVRREKRKQYIDKLAAAGILQSFLDAGGWKE